jgi:hypothetical protein
MPAFSARIQEQALELAWSLWAELGVSGWRRRHTSHAIDPEPLILFTALLGDTDPRLRDEATDWCITYGRYVSAARLRNFLAHQSQEGQEAFGKFAATVNAHSALRWPGATGPRRYRSTGRSEVADFRRPSLVVLRLRTLFGVGARAEILRAFLADQSATLSAGDLAPDAGYTKRNVAEVLDALRMAGLLEVIPYRNQLRYRLAQPTELAALAGDLPMAFPNWRSIFRILEWLMRTAQNAAGLRPNVQRVEAARTQHELAEDLRLVEMKPPPAGDGQDAWKTFERWALAAAEAWASGEPVPGGRRRTAAV